MTIFKTIKTLKAYLNERRSEKSSIGFVPTMGALHNGHLSLIRTAKEQCDVTVCSIFVNPTQFNDKKDFEKYPVTTEKDISLLESVGNDILFLPAVDEIYTEGLQHLQHFELGYLENILEGKYRPGHFQGVCNVVFRLLNIVLPDTIFLGRKDYQQFLVIKKMMHQFFPNTQVFPVDILREENGLAMSSRNMRLSNEGREKASAIYQSLLYIKQNIGNTGITELVQQAKTFLLQNGFEKIDYVEVCDVDTLLPADDKQKKLIALAATFLEEVRLIDNIML